MAIIKGGARKNRACTESIKPMCEVDDDFGFSDVDISKVVNMLDDNKLSSEIEKSASEKILETPVEGTDAGISDIITALIKDEWEAIEGYNSAIVNAKANGYDSIADVLSRIQNEENKHVGELQECLKQITPSAEKIADGTEEATVELAETEIPSDVINHVPDGTDTSANIAVAEVDDDTEGLEELANAFANMLTN